MARVVNQNPLQGMNIYTDKKRRTIYYNPILKKAFQIPTSEFKRFRMFQSRFVTVLAFFVLAFMIFYDWLHMSIWIPIGIGIAALVVFEYLWYKFLNSLPVYKNFDKSKLTSSYDLVLSAADKKKAWVRVALLVAIGILLVFNGYQLHYGPGLMAACYAAMIALLGYALFNIWQISKAKSK